jgi:dolichyl-phosphate-mannose-protein mannosyltransferase
MIWWLSTLAILCYIGVRGFLILRAKRGYRDFDNSASIYLHTRLDTLLTALQRE